MPSTPEQVAGFPYCPGKDDISPTDSYTRVLDGVTCFFSCRSRRLPMCSDWSRIWQLPLRRKTFGPATFAHTDFYDMKG